MDSDDIDRTGKMMDHTKKELKNPAKFLAETEPKKRKTRTNHHNTKARKIKSFIWDY